MSSVSSESFLKAMENLLKDKNEKTYEIFEKEIESAVFLSPVVIVNKNASQELTNSDVSFIHITDADDNKFFLAFTDFEKFNKFKKENPFTPINATLKDFYYMLSNIEPEAKGFVINIGDDALFIPKETFVK